jgi:hypothetical protein
MRNESWVNFKMSLRILSEKIDVCALEQVLRLPSGRFVTKGSQVTKSSPPATMDIWIYDLAKSDEIGFDAALATAAAILLSRGSALVEIRNRLRYHTEFRLSHHTDLAQGRFLVPAHVLRALAEAETALSVSILSWGRVQPGENENENE